MGYGHRMFAPDLTAVIRCRAMLAPMRTACRAVAALAWLTIASASSEVQAQSQSSVGSLLQSGAAAHDPWPELTALEQDLQALERRTDAELPRTWIDTAAAALARARTLNQQGDTAAARRASAIASAAIAAANHAIARDHAQAELAATRRRKDSAIAAAAAARDALAHARAQRDQPNETP